MKFKILLLTILLFTISTALFASSAIDSVGVKNDDGKKVVLFKVKPKDTYYSIGRLYKVSPKAIMQYNGSKKETLSIGEVVMVPTDQPFKQSRKEKEEVAADTKKGKKDKHKKDEATDGQSTADDQQSPPERVVAVQQPVQQPVKQSVQQVQSQIQATQPAVQQTVQNNTPPFQYKVSAGETLYGISKRFGMTVDEVTKLNNLTSTSLSAGQVLMVRSPSVTPPPPPAPVAAPVINTPVGTTITHNTMPVAKRDSTAVASSKDSSLADHHLNAGRFGLYEKNEKGAATWIDDTSLDPNKKLVLHRTAPVGTVIKITNPMTNRTTFAKVVGRFTDTEATKDVILVMTKNVADALGALDKRFYVTISYGSPNE